jgi:hypothetical protein
LHTLLHVTAFTLLCEMSAPQIQNLEPRTTILRGVGIEPRSLQVLIKREVSLLVSSSAGSGLAEWGGMWPVLVPHNQPLEGGDNLAVLGQALLARVTALAAGADVAVAGDEVEAAHHRTPSK